MALKVSFNSAVAFKSVRAVLISKIWGQSIQFILVVFHVE